MAALPWPIRVAISPPAVVLLALVVAVLLLRRPRREADPLVEPIGWDTYQAALARQR